MAYFLMFFAIAMELTGTTFLKMSHGFTLILPTAGCLISYGLCFFSFSRALTSLNLALAYATWSGVGILATTLISWFFFGEKLTPTGIFAILLIIAGCVLLNLFGTKA